MQFIYRQFSFCSIQAMDSIDRIENFDFESA